MVGLADIPCVGKVVDRISDAAVDAIFRGFRYMFCYKDLVKTLDSQVEKASNEENRVSTKVAAERANGKIIEDRVFEWKNKAEEIKKSAQEFAEKYKSRHSWRCIQCLPIPNPVSRFRLGREAVQTTERLTELIKSGKELLDNDIAHLAPAENLPKGDTEFQEFQSRKDSYGEVWRALTTDSSPIVGIYGMPGVGKTRMMEQIWKEAHEKNIFDKVIRANVGNEKLDVIQLQQQIAGYLDCNFVSEDNAESRASQLKQSLLNAGKTLVILDDVWRKIPLDVIGIPCDSKILLTSREEKVCLSNKCQTLVKITSLWNDEAWDLFKNIVGSAQIDSMHDESLAKKVCDKCGGLPLLIHAISKALQFETHNSWADALDQLEKGEFINIPGVEPQVYACVELSINKLHSDAKSCLFLSCLFPEDTYIHTVKLIQFATGSQLVYGESRVLSMVDTLRSSSLLLDCGGDDRFKLHDVIRDVGRSIAFRDPNFAFSQVTCDGGLLDNVNFVTTKFLRLDLDSDNIHIPDDLVCPYLHSLLILCCKDIQQFSGGFFNMSANLRFLFVEGSLFPPSKLEFSLQPLGKLRTLILEYCDLSHINNTGVGFFPENLETLCILNGDLPEPLDLSNLKYLRKLEIQGGGLKMMPNNISNLSRLEILHIPNGVEIWRDDSSALVEPILVEINKLTHLKSLQIKFKICESFQNTNIFDNLALFNICVGGLSYEKADLSYKTSIELQGYHEESLKSLVEKAEFVKLKHDDINVIGSIFDSNREAFTELRKLHIENCNNMAHLARMSQGEIQHSQQTSFSKLTCLQIISCSSLRYLFCNSVAKCLTQLQRLYINDCPMLEAIVMNDGSSNRDIIHFSNLEELELINVPRLRSFAMMQPFTQSRPLFDRMVEFPSLKYLEIDNVEDAFDIWRRDYNNDKCGSCFCKLTHISVQNCNRLETVIPVVMLHNLQNLQTLRVSDCSSVISEIGTEASNKDLCPLLALNHLYLNGLPCLTKTGLKSSNLYPNLKKLEIYNCHGLTNVFLYSSIPRGIVHLEEIIVGTCKEMKAIVGEAEQKEIIDVLVFPELKCLQLQFLPNFTSFCGEETNAGKVEFPNLVKLEISSCQEIKLELIEFSSQLKSLNISCDDSIQVPSTWQPRLHNLETLTLSGCSSHDLNFFWFPRLKWLQVVKYSGCSALFTFSDFRSLQHLQQLVILDCPFLEDIVENDEMYGMDKKTITLSHLKKVILKDLPKLKSFIHGANYGCRVPSLLEVLVVNCGLTSLFMSSTAFGSLQRLEKLYVKDCRMLEGIFESTRGDETSGTTEQIIISLSKLWSLELINMPDLKSFIHGANYECYMPTLSNIEIDNCGFSILFTCSVFRSLQQLQYLTVSNCRLLVVIVEDSRGDETSDTNDKTITLPRLESIRLKHLPNLKSFSRDESYAFNMPKLEYCGLVECPRTQNFTCLNTRTRTVIVKTDELQRNKLQCPKIRET